MLTRGTSSRDARTTSGGSSTSSGCENDIRWLVHELRRHRDALVEVLTRCQDAGDASPLIVDIRHVANDALGLYRPEPGPEAS